MSDGQHYSRLLLPKGHGYPLSHPQPFNDLPLESRRMGTDIGDVGVVTTDGAFDVIFNICRSADDPLNRFGVPDGFEQVDLDPYRDVASLAQYHRPGSHVSNTRISKRRLDVDAGVESNVFLPLGAGAVVEISTSSKEAAVLLLPDGASRIDIRRKKKFRDYALTHAQRWYAFVNGDLERMVDNGDLYLVTGTDKSFSWSVAAVEKRSEDCKISLILKAAQVGSAGTSCVWEWETANSFADSGPRPPPKDAERTENQTVFLRGFKVAISSSVLKRKSAKAISIVNSKPTDIIPKPGGLFSSQSRPTSTGSFYHSSVSSGSSGPSDNEQSIDASAEYFPGNPKVYHPASAINEYLLNASSTANVAVTHDDEWISVLSENDEEVPDDCELIRRLSSKYKIDTSSDGVWLQDSSQQVSNPSVLHEAIFPDGSMDVPGPAAGDTECAASSEEYSSTSQFSADAQPPSRAATFCDEPMGVDPPAPMVSTDLMHPVNEMFSVPPNYVSVISGERAELPFSCPNSDEEAELGFSIPDASSSPFLSSDYSSEGTTPERPLGHSQAASPADVFDSPSFTAELPLPLFPPSAKPSPPYRRREPPGKRRSQGYIPRPPNAFMLFRADFVRQKHVPGTIETNHSSLSKIIGICWRALPLPEKRIWETKAKKAKAEYKIKYPDYKFRHVHNEQGPAPAASASHPSVPPSQPASRSMSGRTIKSALRPEDKRRCEEVATLLLQGKKGEELAWAVRDFDLRHQVELAEPSQSPIPVIYHQNSSKFPHVVKWEGKTRYIQ